MRPLTEFLKMRPVQLVTWILVLQAIAFYYFGRKENVPAVPSLRQMPEEFGHWGMLEETALSKYTQDVLQPDDYLFRLYESSSGAERADLFIAYFKTQRTGHVPHSPKNCLPGAGWAPNRAGYLSFAVPGEQQQVTVNRYLVAKEDAKSVVLYWYQTADRVVASEYRAKIWLVMDAMRYNRSDTALVRVVVPVIGNQEAAAERTAVEFATLVIPLLRKHIAPASLALRSEAGSD